MLVFSLLCAPSPTGSKFASHQPQPLSVTQISNPTLAMSEIVSQLPPLMENFPPPIRVRISSGVSLGPFAKGVQLAREERALHLPRQEERHSCPHRAHWGQGCHNPSHCLTLPASCTAEPPGSRCHSPRRSLGVSGPEHNKQREKMGLVPVAELISEKGLDLGAVHVQRLQSLTEQQSLGLKDQNPKQIHFYKWNFCNCLFQGGLEMGTGWTQCHTGAQLRGGTRGCWRGGRSVRCSPQVPRSLLCNRGS